MKINANEIGFCEEFILTMLQLLELFSTENQNDRDG